MGARHTTAAQLHREIEQTLADRVPGALTPRPRGEAERLPCGVASLDELLRGGLSVGAITELVGAECSGRTSLAQTYLAASVQRGGVAAWVDVEDRLDPVSAAEAGVDWLRLLWVRCGEKVDTPAVPAAAPPRAETLMAPAPAATSPKLPSPPVQGGGSPHPRSEGHGMSQAIEALLTAQPRSAALPDRRRKRIVGTPGAPNRSLAAFAGRTVDREEQIPTDRRPSRREAAEMAARMALHPRCAEPQPRRPVQPPMSASAWISQMTKPEASRSAKAASRRQSNWTPLDQALRATDLLLQTGGFAILVLDLGSTPAEMSWRIPMATWFRFRAACERTRTALVVLTRHPCARSSAAMLVQMEPGALSVDGRVVVGAQHRAEVVRQRFEQPASNIVSIRRPPQSVRPDDRVGWRGAAAWAL